MFKSSLNKKAGPFFLILVAVMLIVFGLLRISLGLMGEKGTACITSIRRQGGERNETVPDRYTYSMGYTFTLPDGSKVNGSTYRIGASVYIKASSSNAGTAPVRYLKAVPLINSLESESGLRASNLIFIGTGIVMLKLITPGKKA